MRDLKPPTPFADALALQAVELFVAQVRTRVMTERSSFAAALEQELLDWQQRVAENAEKGEDDAS